MGRRVFALMMVLALLLSSVASAVAQDRPDGVPSKAEPATVVAVMNGGTISVTLGDGSQRNVGLIGVSAPTVPTATDPGQCYGEEARRYLEGLAVPGSVVWLEADPDIRERDETLLRYVWAVPADGEKAILLNTKMVRDGYADVGQRGDDGKYADRLEEAEEGARDARKGAWRVCGNMHKENPLTDEQFIAQYQQVDIRDVDIRPGSYFGEKITFSGSVLNIQVASPGRVMVLGDLDPQPYAAYLQVQVTAPDGSIVTVSLGYDGDTSGIFEDTWVTVYGVVVDTLSGTNLFGGAITQAFIAADRVNRA